LSLRTSDPNDIMKFYLGSRYSKKLAGLLKGRSSVRFLKSIGNLPKIFKTEWILEYIKDYIKECPEAFFSYSSRIANEDYVSEILPEGFRREFLTIFFNHTYLINDIFRLYQRVGVTKETFKDYKGNLINNYRNLNLEHHRLSELARTIEDENYTKPYDLDPIPEELSLLGFRLPTSNKELTDWSGHFSNCVSGYSQEVSTKKTIVLNWNDEVCLEIKDKKLKQFLGKRNIKTSPEKFWEGVDLLKLNGMIDSEPNNECWGFQPFPQKEAVSQ